MISRLALKWYGLYITVVPATILVLVLGVSFGSSHNSRRRVDEVLGRADARTMQELSPHATLTKAQLLELYDIDCREHRSSWLNDTLKRITRGHLHLDQPTYARLKIVQAGREAVLQPLLDIACDEAGSRDTRFWALNILLYFNDPRVLDAWIKFVEANPRCSPFFEFLLPLSGRSPYCAPGTGVAALKRDMQGKTFEEFVLGLLDARVKDRDLCSDDRQILRYLNRFCGYDFDTWLKASAPEAFEFRNAELRKGYEPIELYHDLFWEYQRKAPRTFDEGILANLLPGSFDRICCQRLLKSYYGVPRMFAETSSDWQQRLVKWYTSARPYLKYDPEYGRFVNTAPSAVDNGGNLPPNQMGQGEMYDRSSEVAGGDAGELTASTDSALLQGQGKAIALSIRVDKTTANLGELLPVRIEASNIMDYSRLYWEKAPSEPPYEREALSEKVSIRTDWIRSDVCVIWQTRPGGLEEAREAGGVTALGAWIDEGPSRRPQTIELSPGDSFGITKWLVCNHIGEYVVACWYSDVTPDEDYEPVRKLECRSEPVTVRIDKSGFDRLVDIVRNADESDLRYCAMDCLCTNDITPAIPVLLAVMEGDPSPEMRMEAAYALDVFATGDLGLPSDSSNYDETVHSVRAKDWARRYIEAHPEIKEPTEEFFEKFMADGRAKHENRQ